MTTRPSATTTAGINPAASGSIVHERLLQFSMTSMVSLSAIVLGMGQESWLLPILALAAAAGGLYYTDLRQTFWLRRWQAFLCALVALAVAAAEASRLEADLRLLALANLLLYLQAILLFHRKTTRVYWELALLSLMQALVAAALNDRIAFAFLLAAYFAAGIVAMTAFLLYRECLAVARVAAPRPSRPLPRLAREEHGAAGDVRALRAISNGRRPAAGRAGTPPSLAVPVWTCSPPEAVRANLLAWSLIRQVARIGLLTLLLTAGLFLAVPRVGKTSWNRPSAEAERTVGLGERVTLGELGELSEDPAGIMQVRFFRYGTGEEIRLRDTLYLRGSLLTAYEGGTWRHDRIGGDAPMDGLPPGGVELVEQWITIEPLDSDVLPAVFPVYPLPDTAGVLSDNSRERLARPIRTCNAQMSYKLATSGLRDGRHLPITFGRRPNPNWAQLDEAQQINLAGLKRLADEAVAGIPAENAYARALALEAHLRAPGAYRYTSLGQPIPQGVDPIEDFAVRTRQGNCEYFASALVLMLRSQGIPARMVVGFKGASFNPLGRFYHVQQLHAHTWVEAHLRGDQVPPELSEAWRGRGWLRLDPTPQSEVTATTVGAVAEDRWPTPRECLEYCRFLWANYVVGLDADKQREAIYKPLVAAVRDGVRNLTDRRAWADFGRSLGDFLTGRGGLPLDWRSGLLASLLALAVGLVGRRMWRRGRSVGRRRKESVEAAGRREPPRVPFYERLEALLQPQDLIRAAGQTQREFALSTAVRLAERTRTRDVAALPRVVVEAFYRVRFGGEALDSAETERVEHALGALAAALAATSSEANGSPAAM